MSLSEKYRPETFTDISGHREQLTQIEGFILSGDIPHLLFYGEPGTCKTTIAGIVANKLLGDNYNGNFIELNASDERKIDDMRKVVIRLVIGKPDVVKNPMTGSLERISKIVTTDKETFCPQCKQKNPPGIEITVTETGLVIYACKQCNQFVWCKLKE